MLIHKHLKDITVTSGSGSDNTLKFSGGQLVQVFLEATTSTNIFDFTITDEDGDAVYEIIPVEGDYEAHGMYMPLRGIYTLGISNATVDEDVRVKILVEE